MSVVTDRRRSSRLRWYGGSSHRDEASLRIDEPGRHGCWVLRAGCELDAARQPQFSALLARSIRSGARVVVLDLRGTDFLSIRVAALLGQAKSEAWGHGVELRLLTGGVEVERALELVGVRPLFRYYLSVDDATSSETGQG
ncbi:STAS domain-containing protein [Nocardia mangyaensis]|uniref:STAS domain-containing protein n=1 Tax=Nocardia mangyaensis TaxID=2213200 RepID=UPI0026763302|nr:STAS domain-containing protein [Nocardia mangyaensis]MDO3646333.1 STAS domain-containing protein [Nocardia mangyaensis]